jgi:hypothetical protein
MIWEIGGKDTKMMVDKKIYPKLKEVPQIENKRSAHDNDSHMD